MISQVVGFLLIVTVIGIIFLKGLTDGKKPLILLPAGMIWGLTVYIFLLNLTTKFIPGKAGILLSTICLLVLAPIALIFIKPRKIQLPKLATLFILSLLLLIVTYFARLKMTSVFPVADSDMQWAYAASFARGNHPLMTPWQPDLNPKYHLGAYFLEGAILSLYNLPFIAIHSILNTYFLIAGCLFTILLLWENKYSFKNLWLIIASLVLFISFGVILFISPSEAFIETASLQDIFSSFTRYPADIYAKGGAGAALVDLNSLSYLPARSLSLGLAFLALYFTLIKFKDAKTKILSFVMLLSVTALVEESMFLLMMGAIFLVFALSYLSFIPNLAYLKSYRKTFFFVVVFTLILVVLQGGFLTDLLNQKSPSFIIKLPFVNPGFADGLKTLKTLTFVSNGQSLNWLFPTPFLFTAAFLIFSYFTKNRVIGLFGLYSLSAFLCYLIIEYRYSPSTNLRLYSFGNIANGVGLVYLFFYILRSKDLRQNFFVFMIFSFFALIPSLLPEILNQYQQINIARAENNRSRILIDSHPKTPFEEISLWANQNLPSNSRLISIDTDSPTPKRSLQFEYKGIYTLLGPQYIHTNRPEPGIEFFDLSLTLNPSLFRETKVEYLYVESESPAYKQLPEFRKNELTNPAYFEILQSKDLKSTNKEDIFYRLYRVKPKYTDNSSGIQETKEAALVSLSNLITANSSVYIADYADFPNFSFWYRMAVILALKDKNIVKNPSQTDYQIIETPINYTPVEKDEKYEYYVLGPGQTPSYPSKLIWSNIYASAWKTY